MIIYDKILSKEEMIKLLESYDLQKLRNDRYNIILNKKIENLVHFTKVENLESILYEGILSADCDFVKCNDERYEELYNYVNTSVSFPNYKLFYKRMMNDKDVDWAVIQINPHIIHHNLDTMFFKQNAGSFNMISLREFAPSYFKSNQAFLDMFAQGVGEFTRHDLLPSYFTTDPQAEILIGNKIKPGYIKNICIKSEISDYNKEKVKQLVKETNKSYTIDNYLFGIR